MNNLKNLKGKIDKVSNDLEKSNLESLGLVDLQVEVQQCRQKIYELESAKKFDGIKEKDMCVTKLGELNTKITYLQKELNDYKKREYEASINKKNKDNTAKETNKALCDIERDEYYIKKLTNEASEEQKEQIGGTRKKDYNYYKNQIESLLSGGIIPKMKKKYKRLLSKEYRKFNNEYNKIKKHGVQHGGANPALIMAITGGKLFLLTVGTFIFDWWPIVVIISIYAAYIEYTMLTVTQAEIFGLDGLSILFALLCPCCWTAARLYKGWSTQKLTETDNLWNILQNCSPNLGMDISKFQNSECEDIDCYITNKQCYNSIFETNKPYVGIFDQAPVEEE